VLGRWIKMQRGEFLGSERNVDSSWEDGTLLLGREYGPRGDGASKLQDRAPHQRRRPFRFSCCSSLSSG
jgi:hypothetical protein